MMGLNCRSNKTAYRIKSTRYEIQFTECDSRGRLDDLVGLDEMTEI